MLATLNTSTLGPASRQSVLWRMMFALVLGLLGFTGATPSFAESPAYKQGYSDGLKAGYEPGYEDGYIGAYRKSFDDSLKGYGTMTRL